MSFDPDYWELLARRFEHSHKNHLTTIPSYEGKGFSRENHRFSLEPRFGYFVAVNKVTPSSPAGISQLLSYSA